MGVDSSLIGILKKVKENLVQVIFKAFIVFEKV